MNASVPLCTGEKESRSAGGRGGVGGAAWGFFPRRKQDSAEGELAGLGVYMRSGISVCGSAGQHTVTGRSLVRI